jgi:hypothetical protein
MNERLGLSCTCVEKFAQTFIECETRVLLSEKEWESDALCAENGVCWCIGVLTLLTHSRRQCFYMENSICLIFPGEDGIFISLTKKFTPKIAVSVERSESELHHPIHFYTISSSEKLISFHTFPFYEYSFTFCCTAALLAA